MHVFIYESNMLHLGLDYLNDTQQRPRILHYGEGIKRFGYE